MIYDIESLDYETKLLFINIEIVAIIVLSVVGLSILIGQWIRKRRGRKNEI